MGPGERQRLLDASVAEDPGDPRSRRYAIRRTEGRIELFVAQCSQGPGDEVTYHGYPWYHPDYQPNPRPVPHSVLLQLRERGDITEEEYGKALHDKLFSKG